TRASALCPGCAALPVALELAIPASIHYLSDLAAVVVEYQRRAAVRPERKARIGLDDHERGGCIEHQLHRLVHPLALLVAHPSPAPLTAAPPTAEAPAPSSAKTATTSDHAGVPATPAPKRLVTGRDKAQDHVPRY